MAGHEETKKDGFKLTWGWRIGIGLVGATVIVAIFHLVGGKDDPGPGSVDAFYMYCWEADDGKPSGLAGLTKKCFILNDYSPEDGTMQSQIFENRDGSRSQSTYKVRRVGPDQYEGTWFELNDRRGITREGGISFSTLTVPPIVATGSSNTTTGRTYSFDIKKL